MRVPDGLGLSEADAARLKAVQDQTGVDLAQIIQAEATSGGFEHGVSVAIEEAAQALVGKHRTCKRCGKPFVPSKYGYMCKDCAKATRAAVMRDRVCTVCGAVFEGGPSAKYCGGCRLAKQRERDRQHRRTGPARKLGSTDVCVRCGAQYIVESGPQKYCKACSDIGIKEAARLKSRAYNRAHKAEQAAHKAEMRRKSAICIICGAQFSPPPDRPASRVCSPDCRRELDYRQQAIADVKRGRRETITRKPPKGPVSGVPGITWVSSAGRWNIKHRGVYIGRAETLETAIEMLERHKAALASPGDGGR